MRRELDLARRLHTLEVLRDAVGAMKSLSAHHYREVRGAVEPARAYREGIERIVGWAGAHLGAGDGGAGLIIIGAELGLCGGYNARVVEAGAGRRAELGEGPTFCVGHRAATLLGRLDVSVERAYPGPTSAGGLTRLLLELGEEVLSTYVEGKLSSFDIVSSSFVGVGSSHPQSVRLLPIAREETGSRRRTRYVEPDRFVTAVVREFLYITLYDLLLDSLASEHGARLTATHAAERWLDERSERVRRQLSATRRETSTQEVIEITAGRARPA